MKIIDLPLRTCFREIKGEGPDTICFLLNFRNMSDYFNIENGKRIYYRIVNTLLHEICLDITAYVLPNNYKPWTDLISKIILTDKQVISMLVKALVPEVAEDRYIATPTELMNKTKCDVFYEPISSY
jgi:hypothetical protein